VSSAEAIAAVVADIRAGNVFRPDSTVEWKEVERAQAASALNNGPVIDATGVYWSLVESGRPSYLYEDHILAPPFECALVCYQNQHGNVIVMDMTTFDLRDELEPGQERMRDALFKNWDTPNPVDWDRVRWGMGTILWMGGTTGGTVRLAADGPDKVGKPMPTMGPFMAWRYAIYDDGVPADLHWTQVCTSTPVDHWNNAQLVHLSAVNFLNCSNVEIVEPVRQRHQRKRLARTGVAVSEIVVTGVKRLARPGQARPQLGHTTAPLSTVRGHFAHYGDCCPGRHAERGRLFGKLTGRYWVPQHARGSADNGTVDQSYRLEPKAGRT
jgi:hypothetical protein